MASMESSKTDPIVARPRAVAKPYERQRTGEPA